MSSKQGWLLVAGVLLILSLTAYGLLASVARATQPIEGLSDGIGTQVARILAPTATVRPDPVTIVREVRELARLETIQYTVEKVIVAESGQGPFGFLFGDRLLLVAHGSVIAGIDLREITPDDIWFDDLGRIFLRLPPAEVFTVNLDNQNSHVYDRDTGLLTRGNIQLESEARRAAEEEIKQAALKDGILEQAQVNAENVLYRFLRSLGFADILFASADEQQPGQQSPPGSAEATSTP